MRQKSPKYDNHILGDLTIDIDSISIKQISFDLKTQHAIIFWLITNIAFVYDSCNKILSTKNIVAFIARHI